MKVISYERFGRLRLADFLIGEMQTEPLENWEFMDRKWVGEAVAFTEFLRLQSDPDVLRSIALNLSVEPQKVWNKVLAVCGVPLQRGMSEKAVRDVLGRSVGQVEIKGTTTLTFSAGEREPYDIRCAFKPETGLSYVVIMRADYKIEV
ncbi:MAG: hypothetical protein JWM97_2861 [Phycisphaerales bacterium]|nr:hypothetical protein [Phycisphaerales bacterium]